MKKQKPWHKGFVERQFRRVIVSIDYDPSPYYGDCKKCEWKAGEHVTAFFKTQGLWEEITADFCRKWSSVFLELVRAEIIREDDIARGWTLRFPRQMCNYKLKKEGKL